MSPRARIAVGFPHGCEVCEAELSGDNGDSDEEPLCQRCREMGSVVLDLFAASASAARESLSERHLLTDFDDLRKEAGDWWNDDPNFIADLEDRFGTWIESDEIDRARSLADLMFAILRRRKEL